eukprot:CAMPEP_0118944338 /NCGR_PEP_ID=MMETSP1169-20130426/40106_1 /TAXON_ID=36882 /ORGANISM="Pyramimonas obovata, Strain CCMP722" /LENGTH=270 /DNA_ID=CAMNT_0006889799 /DNA_START=138 /DNA_END=947 /DNA_ORIENTATION=-
MGKAAEKPLTREEQQSANDYQRLVDRALKQGMLSKSRPDVTTQLQPTKVITTCNNKDIVKKGSSRKNRYLFAMPAVISPVAAGTMGSIAEMDTRNPVLYMDFPQGRMKFVGTIVHTTTRYLMLKFAKTVLCEDCFDSLVVFSDWYWVGKKSINPEERRLPLPQELRDLKIHSSFSLTAGAGEDGGKTVDVTHVDVEEDEAMDDSSNESGDSDPDQDVAIGRRSARAVATKRKSYVEKDSDDEGGSDDSGGGSGRKKRQVEKLPQAKNLSE